jgi:BON domain
MLVPGICIPTQVKLFRQPCPPISPDLTRGGIPVSYRKAFMKIFLALIVGIAIGIAAVWYFNHDKNNSQFRTAGEEIKSTAKSAGDTISDKLKSWRLDPDSISDELKRTGRVIRDKTSQAGQAIKDATADARVSGAIKAKLVKDPDLSAWDIHVSTSDGVVTLSGTVSSPDMVGKAMELALDTDGARQVISTLQVKPKT